jgi:hypothetical protein
VVTTAVVWGLPPIFQTTNFQAINSTLPDYLHQNGRRAQKAASNSISHRLYVRLILRLMRCVQVNILAVMVNRIHLRDFLRVRTFAH